MAADRRLLVGKIVGLHGVAGGIKLESFTEPRIRIFSYRPWFLKTNDGEIQCDGASGRELGKGMVAKLPAIDNRDAAAALIGVSIEVWRSVLPMPMAGEVYWTDLEGLAVATTHGIELGKISHVFSTGANDVMVVRDESRERLIPFVRPQFVQEVDLEAGRVTVDWDPEF
ncbi:MAG: ribosome maturation factor RimM [Rudaea sp.]